MNMRFVSPLFALVVVGMTLAVAPAMAGHDETSEVNAPLWAVGAPSPGGVPGHGAAHLLVTEVAVTPTAGEFIEIHNPTALPVDLTNYYLTDAWFAPGGVVNSYHLLPTGTFQITTNTDFCSRFPAGTVIPAFGTFVIAMYSPGVDSIYGPGTANFEVTSVSPTVPDMISVGNNAPPISANSTTLTNTSELAMLFRWDGVSDNVCDVDYVTWGPLTTTSRVVKTGLATDGPDGDAIATSYNADTPAASQSSVGAPGFLLSVARLPGLEGVEATGGNGCCLPASVDLAFNPETLNLNSHGRWVTVYLEPASPYSASDIDVSSLSLNGAVPVDPDGPVEIGDEDNDGIPDLMVKFSRSDVAALLSPGEEVGITVTGGIGSENCFEATDAITVIAVTLPNPIAGSVVLPGSQVEITWKAPNGPLTADLIVSYDDGATWTIEARDLPNNGRHTWTVPSVNVSHARVGIVTIATENAPDVVMSHEYGESDAFGIDAVTGVGDGSLAFALHGVQPNPGRGSLNVAFSLPSGERARLAVYDVTGRQVAGRDLDGLGAGRHVLSFGQRERLAAGVYLVQLSQNGRSVKLRAVVIE